MIKNACYLCSVFCFVFVISLCFPIVSYCDVATSSNASDTGINDSDNSASLGASFDMEDLENEQDFEEYTEDFYTSDLLSGIYHAVMDIHDMLSPATPSEAEYVEDTEVYETVEPYSDDFSITPYAVNSLPDHDVVNVKGRFGGTVYTLVVPRQYYANLWVSDSGILYNLSSSNITCRMFTGTTFNDTDYNYRLLTLLPLLGNSSSALRNYGTISYQTYYYFSGSNWTSSNTYGNFMVDSIDIKRSLDIDYRLYYVALAILFSEGLVFLCFWKNSRQL